MPFLQIAFPEQNRETRRLSTYLNFPSDCPINCSELARYGFFYDGVKDKVKCFSCGMFGHDWRIDDQPNDKRWHLETCSFVIGIVAANETANIPLNKQKPLNFVGSFITNQQTEQDFASISSTRYLELERQFPCLHPVNPHMKEFNTRLQTFDQRWPGQKVNATPQHIAKAGFYFLGERDRAKCWYCNGGLQNWEPNDEPFTEHAKWFPGCEFLLQCKGVEFVKNVVVKFPNLRRPALRNPKFDHKTLKLIPMNSSNQLANIAVQMGFDSKLVCKVIQRKNFSNVNELIEELLTVPSKPSESKFFLHSEPHTSQFDNIGLFSTQKYDNTRGHYRGRTNNDKDSLKDLEKERNCKLCLVNEAIYVLLPCGHLALCKSCVSKTKSCPMCRQKILTVIF